ncbi:hypothetical protein B1199_05835 [Pseudoalteromonas ulvae]|uniref:Uncharacterized protein n=1 Tax=Pseudoalteromonas ulvae TaxID=107327 RepID=A0A244CW07_PSEDV|nr:hypothetical protein [Pseudoalteromonas ulvae]OUL59827.1 hypothetical protein B1199_05835 [Pseudoalteromonas ulvae]
MYRLGNTPKLSLKRFLIGLCLFVFSAGFIMYGYFEEPLYQLAGLILLAPALFFAIYGYIGLFANRFSQVISINDPVDTNKHKQP